MKFIVDKNIPMVKEAFEKIGEVKLIETGALSAESVYNGDVLIIRSETKVNRSLLDGSKVKFVGTATIGTDHLDIDYLERNGIAHANAPGCNSNSVKEYIISALLDLSKTFGFSLKGKTIGVVGVGNVGSKVAHAAETMGMHVMHNDPPLARQTGEKRFLSLDKLMDADIITLHVPLSTKGQDPTYHLFDSKKLNRCKKGTIFINTSRGAVVETNALIKSIRAKQLGMTVIDVWENEPMINPELLSMVNLGTAHIAGYSLDGKINGIKMIYDLVCKHFSIASTWYPHDRLQKQKIGTIIIPNVKLSLEEILYEIVKNSYDIAFDDFQLREMLSKEKIQHAEHFIKLRADYRLRREFSNTSVQLPEQHKSLRKTINELGFKCNIYS